MKLSPRDEIIVGVVAILLVVVALSMLLVRPQLARLGEIATQKQQEESKVRNAQAELELLKAAKGEALGVQADLLRVGNQVPDSPQLPSLVVEIQDLANEAGISFVSIKPGDMVASGGYTTLPIDLELRGAFFDVVDFIYRLEHLTRQVRVTELDLTEAVSLGGTSGGTGAQGSTSGETGGQGSTSDEGLDLVITANVFVMGTVPGAEAPVATPGKPAAPSGGAGGK